MSGVAGFLFVSSFQIFLFVSSFQISIGIRLHERIGKADQSPPGNKAHGPEYKFESKSKDSEGFSKAGQLR